jgi:hypothetical protein
VRTIISLFGILSLLACTPKTSVSAIARTISLLDANSLIIQGIEWITSGHLLLHFFFFNWAFNLFCRNHGNKLNGYLNSESTFETPRKAKWFASKSRSFEQ